MMICITQIDRAILLQVVVLGILRAETLSPTHTIFFKFHHEFPIVEACINLDRDMKIIFWVLDYVRSA